MTTTEGTDPVFNNERTGERLTALRMLELIATTDLVNFFIGGPLPGSLPVILPTAIGSAITASMSAALDPFIIRSTVLQAGTMTGVSNITVTSIPAWVKNIGIVVDDFNSGGVDNFFAIQLSIDNGSTWLDDEYTTVSVFGDNVATTVLFSSNEFVGSISSVAGDITLTAMNITGIQEGAFPYATSNSYNFDLDEAILQLGALVTTTARIDALRLLSDDGGNFDGGTYTIVGYA